MTDNYLKKIQRLLILTTIIILAATSYSAAWGEEAEREESSFLVMEKVTDFFSRDNLKLLEDTKERFEELTDSIGRGSEIIGESIEKLTNFIGFGDRDGEEEIEETRENDSAGQVVGTIKTKNGEAVENIRVNLGNYATYTDERGEFDFHNIAYGVYSLSYQENQSEASKNIEEILIDSDNRRYVVSLVLDTGSEGEVLVEDESVQEIVVDEGSNFVFIIFMFLVLLAVLLLLAINRKHIKIVDGGTGETLGKKKVDIKPVTWIDLTEEFQQASHEKIRVRFIRSAIRKLYGKKVVFTVDGKIIAEIQEYTGELDFLVQRKSVIQGNKDLEEGRD